MHALNCIARIYDVGELVYASLATYILIVTRNAAGGRINTITQVAAFRLVHSFEKPSGTVPSP